MSTDGTDDSASNGEHEMLVEVALPTDSSAPRTARLVVSGCLAGVVAQRILHDAELLVSELVTNSLDHGELGDSDHVLLRVYLAEAILRLEIENSGSAGVIAIEQDPGPVADRSGGFGLALVELLAERWGVSRNHNTNVWFEMGRG